MNAIAFSLWGSIPMYCQGATRNAELMPKIYPGWKAVFYVDHKTVDPLLVHKLVDLKADVRGFTCSNGMFARFFAAEDPQFERVIFRDTDSRISEREAKAVAEWIKSDKRAHVIADHPHHTPVMGGGMWGIKSRFEVGRLIDQCESSKMKCDRNIIYNSDQIWLRDVVWPIIKDDCLIHDFCYHDRRTGARPFPAKFGDMRFVGEVFNEKDEPRSFDASMRMNWMTP